MRAIPRNERQNNGWQEVTSFGFTFAIMSLAAVRLEIAVRIT
jgi:hypothetical protein